MNVGSLVDEKLAVRYTSGSEVTERRKKKRKEKFTTQVARAVKMMKVNISPGSWANTLQLFYQDNHTLRYVEGRTYEKKDIKKYQRESRVDGVPASFGKLNLFLEERKLELCDFVRITQQKEKEAVANLPCDENDVEADPPNEDLEVGPENMIGDDDDFTDVEFDGSDSE